MYVLPLVGIVIACAVMGPRAATVLGRIEGSVRARWPIVAAPLAVLGGVALVVFGAIKL